MYEYRCHWRIKLCSAFSQLLQFNASPAAHNIQSEVALWETQNLVSAICRRSCSVLVNLWPSGVGWLVNMSVKGSGWLRFSIRKRWIVPSWPGTSCSPTWKRTWPLDRLFGAPSAVKQALYSISQWHLASPESCNSMPNARGQLIGQQVLRKVILGRCGRKGWI